MAALPFESPEFTAILAASDAQFAVILAGCADNGITFPAFAAMCIDMTIVAEAREAAGQFPARDGGRQLRASRYATGELKAPHRETVDERTARRAKVMGMYKGAA